MQMLIFILWGALAGRTIQLNRFQFIDGRCEVTAPEKEMPNIAHFLAINWQAFPEGDPRLEVPCELSDVSSNGEAEQISGDNQPNGGELVPETSNDGGSTTDTKAGEAAPVSDGGGQQTVIENAKLVAAIAQLDHAVDSHWTADGRPAMKAVEAFYGSTDITRADVDAAAPGFSRVKPE